MNRITRMTIRKLLTLAIISVGPAGAQNFDLSWFTIDGGGEMFSTGGGYELAATIGQPVGVAAWPLLDRHGRLRDNN